MVANARYNGKNSFEEWQKDWELEERYNFKKIEAKWQKIWEDEKAYKVEIDHDKEKFYALVEFPYPSGAGLHVGHPRSYTALDVISRKKEWKVLMFCTRWDLMLSDCRQRTMQLRPAFILQFLPRQILKTLRAS